MLYILLPVFNRSNITKVFATQLKAQTYQDFQLILIDDASTDDTVKIVKDILPNTIVLNGGGKAWWAGGLQMGYEYVINNVKSPYSVLIINDDTEFENDFFHKAVNHVKENHNMLIKATEIEKNNLQPPFRFVFANIKNNKFIYTEDESLANCTTTRGLFVSDHVFKSIGGFYPDKLPHYLSDYEYTIRATRMGFKIFCPDDLIVKIDLSTTGLFKPRYKNLNQYYNDFFSNRNMINPKHKIQFILLTQPSKFYRTINILKTVLVGLKDFFKIK